MQKTGEFRKIQQIERKMLMFKKNNLKTGMLIETKGGRYYLFFSDPGREQDVLKEVGLDGTIKDEVIKMDTYRDDLTSADEEQTIISVYNADDIGNIGDFMNYKLVWERKVSPYVIIKHVKEVFLMETGDALILF